MSNMHVCVCVKSERIYISMLIVSSCDGIAGNFCSFHILVVSDCSQMYACITLKKYIRNI